MSTIRSLFRFNRTARAQKMARKLHVNFRRKITPNELHESEYKRDYEVGEKAEWSYNTTNKFPAEWKPYNYNVNLSWMVYAAAGFFYFCLYMYEQTYLEETGRQVRDSNRKYYRS